VPELHRDPVRLQGVTHLREPRAVVGRVAKRFGHLEDQTEQLARGGHVVGGELERGQIVRRAVVADGLRHFERKAEPRRRAAGHLRDLLARRWAVERRVDFDGRELCGVVRQHIALRGAARIEPANPRGVRVPGRAEMELHGDCV
jgi:hypothetical protein